MNQAEHISSSSLFLPLREKGEDFGMVSTFGQRLFDQTDGIGVDRKTTAVEPILDIGGTTDPFKVICPVIGFDFIFMMNNLKPKWIRNEGLGDKTVNHQGSYFSSARKFHFWISASAQADDHFASSGPSFGGIYGMVAVNKPIKTSNPTEVANLIAFISDSIAPFFSRGWIKKFWTGAWKKLCYGSLDVKHFGLSPAIGRTKVSHQISIIDRILENFGRKNALKIALPVFSNTAKASNTMLAGNFVHAFVSGNRKPNLGLITHCLSPVLYSFHNEQDRYRHKHTVGQANKKISKFKEM